MLNRREKAKQELNSVVSCCVNYVTPALALVATRTAIGALDGAIGFELMRAGQNWTAPGYTISNTVASQAIGAAILSPVSVPLLVYLVHGAMDLHGWDKNYNHNTFSLNSLIAGTISSTALNAVFGTLDGLVGAAVLDLLPPDSAYWNTNPQSNFAAAVGASGGAVTALGVFGILLLLRLAYLLSAVCDYTDQNNKQPSQPAMLSQFSSKRTNANPMQAEVVEVLQAEIVNDQSVSSKPLYLV